MPEGAGPEAGSDLWAKEDLVRELARAAARADGHDPDADTLVPRPAPDCPLTVEMRPGKAWNLYEGEARRFAAMHDAMLASAAPRYTVDATLGARPISPTEEDLVWARMLAAMGGSGPP